MFPAAPMEVVTAAASHHMTQLKRKCWKSQPGARYQPPLNTTLTPSGPYSPSVMANLSHSTSKHIKREFIQAKLYHDLISSQLTSILNRDNPNTEYHYQSYLCPALVPPILYSEGNPTSLPLSVLVPPKSISPREPNFQTNVA